MIKLLPICLALIVLMSAPVCAFDNSIRPYIGVFAGSPITSVNKFSDASGSVDSDFNPGMLGGLSVGVSVDSNWGYNIDRFRLEAEAAFRTSELVRLRGAQGQRADVNGTVSVMNYMLNGYVENANFATKDMPVSIFLTAGAGTATATITSVTNKGKTLVSAGNNVQFAYQGGVGFGSGLSKNISLDVIYKYMGTTPFKFSGVSVDYGSHNVMIGARYLF